MVMQLLYPPAEIVRSLSTAGSTSLRELCATAGVPCRASGAWTGRKVRLVRGSALRIRKEPGDEGAVEITLPAPAVIGGRQAARMALGAMAYGLMDPVARESIRGAEWTRPAPPRGRPRTSVTISNRERQRRLRDAAPDQYGPSRA